MFTAPLAYYGVHFPFTGGLNLRKERAFMFKTKRARALCSAVVPSAGSSKRMGGENKLFSMIDGVPVIVRSLLALQASGRIFEIVVVARPSDIAEIASLCKEYGISKVSKIISGGETRQESVLRGIMEVSGEASYIAIHDGARPLVPVEVIDEAVDAAGVYHAAAPGIPVFDTVKVMEGGLVRETPDRDHLRAIQTPQVFDADLIKGAIHNAVNKDLAISDDCEAVEAMGVRPYITPGSRENIKITTQLDIFIAEAILRSRI